MAMKPRAMKKMASGGNSTKKATMSDFNKMLKSLGLTKAEVADMLGLTKADATGVKRNMMRGGTPKKPMMRGGMSKKKK